MSGDEDSVDVGSCVVEGEFFVDEYPVVSNVVVVVSKDPVFVIISEDPMVDGSIVVVVVSVRLTLRPELMQES